MADAKIMNYGQPIGAGSTAIPDNTSEALDIESTDAKDYVTIQTTDGDERIIFGQEVTVPDGTLTNPSLRFTGHNSGFYDAGGNGHIGIVIDGSRKYDITDTHLNRFDISKGFELDAVAATATNPVYTFNGDDDTGVGTAADDQLSLIAGGQEGIRVTEAGDAITNITCNGPVGVREAAVENHWSGARDAVIKGVNNSGITLRAASSSYSSSVAFADADGTSAEGVGGCLQYVHSADYFRLYAKWAGSNEYVLRINEYGAQKHRNSLAQDSTARDSDTNTSRPAYLADTTATLILDYEFGTVAEVTLAANITAIKIFNAPPHGSSQTMTVRIKQHSTAVTLSYSSVTIYSDSGSTTKAGNLLWSGNAEHVMSTGNNQIDIVQFTCMPHGDTNRDIYASVIGQNFS